MEPDCGIVIVAGGSGTRMGGGEPKQFRLLAGKPLLRWSLEFFAGQPAVTEIVVVAPEAYLAQAGAVCEGLGVEARCVVGGQRRQDSVSAGLAALSDRSTLVAVHDGARPFPPDNFSALLDAARESGAAIFALPVTDSIKRADGGAITDSVPRAGLWAAQTPQAFRTPLLREALDQCNAQEVTDDAAAVEMLGHQVRIIEGTRRNLKVTLPDDFAIAAALISGR